MGPMQLPVMPPVPPMLAKAVGGIPGGAPELRAEVGRLPVHHLPRRRRGGDRQPQRETHDPLLPRARGGAEGEPAAAVRAGRRDRPGGRVRGPAGLRRPAAADPPRRQPGEDARRADAGASSWPSTCWPWATRTTPAGPSPSGGPRWKRRSPAARRPVHLTAATQDKDAGRTVVPPVRGRRPGRDHCQAAGRAVPAGQARDVQDQARTHRRLRRGRLPACTRAARTRSARCCSACTRTTATSPAWV